MNTEKYDVIVVGSGHAGCEACLATARMGLKTLLLTLNLDSIAFLACNPSIGGTAKGHLVCEIDALGGEMGVVADKATIHRRMLNSSKGPAVQSIRTQTDKILYHQFMKQSLENQENLFIKQAEVSDIVHSNGKITGIKTGQGQTFLAESVIICTGVYLKSRVIIGDYVQDAGPNGFQGANSLTQSLVGAGFDIFRFKTGTPVRVHADSIDYSQLTPQLGEDDIQTFSFITKKAPKNFTQCHLTYTNSSTHEIIRNNLDKSPLYSGIIKGQGPRYCPSIEDKIVKFADKESHQLFLEPEALNTKEVYIQGFSTSLPVDVQHDMVRSLKGLENAHIMRDAYAIEYDCINSMQLFPTLESKIIDSLFFAGQVNGTSGYEEAAAQGIMAGINSALKILGKEQLVLRRDQAYIGVLIDDLVTKGTNEPYRMMTSRAEYRLHLRQDNADVRLTEIGREVGLVSDYRYKVYKNKVKKVRALQEKLQTRIPLSKKLNDLLIQCGENTTKVGMTLFELLRRPGVFYKDIAMYYDVFDKYPRDVLQQVEIDVKYSGYLKRQDIQIGQMKKQESIIINYPIDFYAIKGLRKEAQQKLAKVQPLNIGQASRISGVSPADISVLVVYLKAHNKR